MRVKKHFKRNLRCSWLATKCSRLCSELPEDCSRILLPEVWALHRQSTRKVPIPGVTERAWDIGAAVRESHFGTAGSRALVCVTLGLRADISVPEKPGTTYPCLVKSCHFRCEFCVGWEGGRKGKLSESEFVGRKGKTTLVDISGKVSQLSAKPSGSLPICFAVWNILFFSTSRLKQPSGIYNIYLKTANIFNYFHTVQRP